MPAPVIRPCIAVPRTVMLGVLPIATPLSLNLFRSRSPNVDLATASPRFSTLFGRSGTDRLVGTTVLNSVLSRNTGSIGSKASGAVQRFDPMIEPWGTLIRLLQPDFLSAGFIRIHEDQHSITFSDGKNKVELSVSEHRHHPSIVALYTNKNGVYHRLTNLMEKLDSLETRKKDFEAHCALMEKYGMWNNDTPIAMQVEGYRAGLSLGLKQMITFLATHKTTLSKLKPDAESLQYSSVRPKASEKTEPERRIFQRLWLSRHDR